jgi:type IV pilus assembly protein PilN
VKLEINLATRFYVNFKRVNFYILLALLILIVWISAGIYSVASNFSELRKFSSSTAKMAAKSGKEQVSESDFNKMLEEVKYVNSILVKRSVNWLSLFDRLEMLVPEGVALRALEPSDAGQTLRISGSARSFTYIRKFMENLESSSNFTEIYLTNHAIVKVGSSQKGIDFTVTCKANI